MDLKNESVTSDPLLGNLQFDPVATPEQHQFNGSGKTIEQDSLIYSAGRVISVSGRKLTTINFC